MGCFIFFFIYSLSTLAEWVIFTDRGKIYFPFFLLNYIVLVNFKWTCPDTIKKLSLACTTSFWQAETIASRSFLKRAENMTNLRWKKVKSNKQCYGVNNATFVRQWLQNLWNSVYMLYSMLFDELSDIVIEPKCNLMQCSPSMGGYHPCYSPSTLFLYNLWTLAVFACCWYPEFIYFWYILATEKKLGPLQG